MHRKTSIDIWNILRFIHLREMDGADWRRELKTALRWILETGLPGPDAPDAAIVLIDDSDYHEHEELVKEYCLRKDGRKPW